MYVSCGNIFTEQGSPLSVFLSSIDWVPFHSKPFITHSFIKIKVFWDVILKMKACDSLKHLQLCTNWYCIIPGTQLQECQMTQHHLLTIINMHHTEEVDSSDMSDFYLGVASAGTVIQLMLSIIFSVLPGSCANTVLEFNADCFLHSSVVFLTLHPI
jgi:hypothetical protein